MKQLKYLLLLIVPLLILSCRTPKERAERLVKRANRIYPIDSLVSEKIKIDTLLAYDTTVIFKHDTATISIPVYVEGTKTPIKYNKKVIHDGSRARVTATTGSNGSIDLDILFKEQKMQVKGTVRYQKQIITHRKLITVHVKVRGWIWWVGMITVIAIGVASIFLSIRIIKKDLP